MRTISQVVEEIILASPFLSEVMAEGVANNAKIARKIKAEVEKRLLEEVSEPAISMALHRLSGEFRKKVPSTEYLKNIDDITVRSNLIEFIFPNTMDISRIVETAFDLARAQKDAFVNFSRGISETLLIVNADFESKLAGVLPKENCVRREDLSAITMRLPEASLNVPGLYYPILKAIAWEGISFVEVMSVDREFSIIFEDKDVERAFAIIKRLVS